MTEKEIKRYIKNQNAWLKRNNIKGGDLLFAKTASPSWYKGWNNSWNDHMNQVVGKTNRFREANGQFGIGLFLDRFYYPYFIFKKVKTAEQELKLLKLNLFNHKN